MPPAYESPRGNRHTLTATEVLESTETTGVRRRRGGKISVVVVALYLRPGAGGRVRARLHHDVGHVALDRLTVRDVHQANGRGTFTELGFAQGCVEFGVGEGLTVVVAIGE